MNNGYLKVAAAMPQIYVGGIFQNTQNIKKMIMDLNAQCVDIALFPEMCLYGASQSPLAAQNALITECEEALLEIAQYTKNRQVLCAIGLPLRVEEKILNCVAVVGMGKIWCVIYKSNYKLNFDQITLGDYSIPFSARAIMRCNSDLPVNIAINIGKDLDFFCNTSANIILNPFSADLGQFDNYFDQIKNLSQSPPKAIISASGAIYKTPYAEKSCVIAECGKILSVSVDQPIATAELDIERIAGLRTLANNTFFLTGKTFENAFIELPLEKDTHFVRKRKYSRQPYTDDNFEKIYKRLIQILYELIANTKKKVALRQGEHFWLLLSLLLDTRQNYSVSPSLVTLLLDEPQEQDLIIKNSGFNIQLISQDKSQNIKNAYVLDWAQKNNSLILNGMDRTDYIRHKNHNINCVNPLINFNKTALMAMLRQRRKYDYGWSRILEQNQPSLDDIIIDFFIYHHIDCGLSAQKTKQIAYETFEDIKKTQDLWDEFVVTI
ncbi:MAG TPA: hypothetical protein GX745_06895 [Clostridiales bacterium]|jgi:hypothetical protein|nr:hypothetical protein [Clostridiales bacterium]